MRTVRGVPVFVGTVKLTLAKRSDFDLVGAPLATAEQRTQILADATALDAPAWKLQALRNPIKVLGVTTRAWIVLAQTTTSPAEAA